MRARISRTVSALTERTVFLFLSSDRPSHRVSPGAPVDLDLLLSRLLASRT